MFSLVALALLLIPPALALRFYFMLVWRQAFTPIRHLRGPPVPSFFLGNLHELHDQENTNLVARWVAEYGSTFIYRGFVGGFRLMLTDPLSVNYVMAHGYEYPKPDYVRDSLASMAAGYEGLVTAEGEQHRKQRKILNPAFTGSQLRLLTPIFWEKAVQLRDIWMDSTSSPQASYATTDPLAVPVRRKDPEAADRDTTPERNTSPSALTTSFLAKPFSSFVPSKSAPKVSQMSSRTALPQTGAVPVKLDVLSWLGRATLDVIGTAGFGYDFGSLAAGRDKRQDETELARAFGEIFGSARKLRGLVVLRLWFPFLRHFAREGHTMQAARATMRRIGLELIEERRAAIEAEHTTEKSNAADTIEGARTHLGRDLLSVLIRSNISSVPTQRMSTNETLCQISTFLAAGHETTASAVTWTLYTLARYPAVQRKLRKHLRAVPLPSTTSGLPDEAMLSTPEIADEFLDSILSEPYLDAVVSESARIHAPVSGTMRVATKDDVIPLDRPIVDKYGKEWTSVPVREGDIIAIPIQYMNKHESTWGADANEFRPERWEARRDADADTEDEGITAEKQAREKRATVHGLYRNTLTFGAGHPKYGNRSCIGYRFAINEMKIFLYALVRDLEFSLDPTLEIEKKINVVSRPIVKSEPERGNQMPLLIRRVPPDES